MTKTELEKYKRQLQLDRALILEASGSGASLYITLLGCTELALATVNKLIAKKIQNDED